MEINGIIHHKFFSSDKLGFEKTIFEVNGELLSEYKGINLSGGFPAWETPKFVKEALAKSTFEENENNYSQCAGHLGLRSVIAKSYQKVFNRSLSENNVVVGDGGTGLIFLLFYSLIQPDDEIILIEPFFQYFYINSFLSKTVIKTYEMNPINGSWEIDFEKLEKLFSNKTKLILINSPHNPTGKVFNKEEIENFRKILNKFPNVIILADEVYEKAIYDKADFQRIGTYEDMWPRTITLLSAGKTFNVTGWRVGYAIADEPLINCLIAAQRAFVFCSNRPCSSAVAKLIPQGELPYEGYSSYYEWHRDQLQKSKDLLVEGLRKIPEIKVYPPKGGFFFVIGIEGLIPFIPKKYFYKKNISENNKDNESKEVEVTPSEACFKWLAIDVGVNIIPMDSFYQNEGRKLQEIKGKNLLRVSVCPKPESIELAIEKIRKIIMNH